jgi:hypothetical protein
MAPSIPKSPATRAMGFSRFRAMAAAPALNSRVYIRRSWFFFPIFSSPSVMLLACLSIYQMG